MTARNVRRGKPTSYDQGADQRRNLMLALAAALTLALCCAGGLLLALGLSDEGSASIPGPTPTRTPATSQGSSALRVAVAPEAMAVLKPITDDFNRQGKGTVTLVSMAPADMVDALSAGQPSFDAAVPDSSFWLPRLDQAWADTSGQESLTGLVERFMLSPVIIATWQDVAAGFGARPSWADFLKRAEGDATFRWSHPSAKTGPGFLAILGEVYFAAGKTWGLTLADLERQQTRDTFNRIEQSVAQYGESEEATLQTLLEKGPAYLSAFVATERAVVKFNTASRDRKLRAVYPAEGAAWADYPLTLLDGDWVSPQVRTLYTAYAEHLASEAPQRAILAAGFRTVNAQVPVTGAGSPLSANNGVDPRQPKVALQIPEEAVVDRLVSLWAKLKRHSQQVWVVDTSGSMGDAQKLQRVKDALLQLIDQVDAADEVGLIKFSDRSQLMVPIAPMNDTQKATMRQTVRSMTANGNTALLDAAAEGFNLLQARPSDKINGLIVLTDGEENRSTTRMNALVDLIRTGNAKRPTVVFCIAYGGEAGTSTLKSIAGAAGALGQVRSSDPASIKQLYQDLLKYF